MQRRVVTLLSERDVREFCPPSDLVIGQLIEPKTNETDETQRAAKRRRITLIANNYVRGEVPYILTASLRGPFDASTQSDPEASKWKNPWRVRKAQRPGVGPAEAAGLRSQVLQQQEEQKVEQIERIQKERDRRQARRKRQDRAAELRQDGLGMDTETPIDLTTGDVAHRKSRMNEQSQAMRGKHDSDWLRRRQSSGQIFDADTSYDAPAKQSPARPIRHREKRKGSPTSRRSSSELASVSLGSDERSVSSHHSARERERKEKDTPGPVPELIQLSDVASTEPETVTKLAAGLKRIPRPTNLGARIAGRHSNGRHEAHSQLDSPAVIPRKAATTGRKNKKLNSQATADFATSNLRRGGRTSRPVLFDTPVLLKRGETRAKAMARPSSELLIDPADRDEQSISGHCFVRKGALKIFKRRISISETKPADLPHPTSSPAKLQDVSRDPYDIDNAVLVPSTAPQSTLTHRSRPSGSGKEEASRSGVQHSQELDLIKISNDIDTQAIAAEVDDAFDDLFNVTEVEVAPESIKKPSSTPAITKRINAITPFQEFHLNLGYTADVRTNDAATRMPMNTQALLDAVSPFAETTAKKTLQKHISLSSGPSSPQLEDSIFGPGRGVQPQSTRRSVLPHQLSPRRDTNDLAQQPLTHAHDWSESRARQRSPTDSTPSTDDDQSDTRASTPASLLSPRTRARRISAHEGEQLLNRNSFTIASGVDVVESFLKSWDIDTTPALSRPAANQGSILKSSGTTRSMRV